MQMTVKEERIHQLMLSLGKKHREVEARLIEILQQVDDMKFYRKLDQPSLFMYATKVVGLSESVAYALIAVSRKAKEIPLLKEAIEKQKLSVSRAVRLTSGMTKENAKELIEFAQHATQKQIDFEMAKRNPESRSQTRVKPISENHVNLIADLPTRVYEKLQRIQSLQAQKQKSTNVADVIEAVFDAYLFHNDPVLKAERAMKRKVTKPCAHKVARESWHEKNENSPTKRIPLTAEQKHAVVHRDQGRCTYIDAQGNRCNQDRWTQTHHITLVSKGGGNESENLTTLCSFHHDLVHQLSLPIDGQINWLRSPARAYG